MIHQSLLAGAAAVLLAAIAPHGAQAQDWPLDYSNPKPAAGDVALPMPCGGAMVFRRVDVASANPLADKTIRIGEASSAYGAVEGPIQAYIAGGFASGDKRASLRSYLVGKYEVNRLQFDAVFGRCGQPAGEMRLPRVGLDWAEAADFARRYTEWLAANALAKLPIQDGTPGFFRLPTEAEWEFAARGGAMVTDAEFENATHPMSDEPHRYVWYAGTESSNNRLNAVGLLDPNPLGLHDMLGNAAEFVGEGFRLNLRSRWHGQTGGYVVKGGSFRTELADLSAGARSEYTPIGPKGVIRDDTIGFRLVLAPPVVSSTGHLKQVSELWAKLGTGSRSSGIGAEPIADPLAEAKTLASATEDPALKKRIERLGNVIAENVAQRDEQRDSAAKSEIRLSALLMNKLIEDRARLDASARRRALLTGAETSPESNARRRAEDEVLENIRRENEGELLTTVRRIAREYPVAVIRQQSQVLATEYVQRKVSSFGPLIETVTTLAQEEAGGKAITAGRLSAAIAPLKQAGR